MKYELDSTYEGALVWKGHAEEAADNCRDSLRNIIDVFKRNIQPNLEQKKEKKANEIIDYFKMLEKQYF